MGQRGSTRAGRDRGEGLSQKALKPLHCPVKTKSCHRIRAVMGRVLSDRFAERLLGSGDMLYLPAGTGLTQRVHGAYVADHEVHKVVEYLRAQGKPDYIEEVLEPATMDEGGAAAGYQQLEVHLGDPVSRIPRGRTRLDREDVWLGALAHGRQG